MFAKIVRPKFSSIGVPYQVERIKGLVRPSDEQGVKKLYLFLQKVHDLKCIVWVCLLLCSIIVCIFIGEKMKRLICVQVIEDERALRVLVPLALQLSQSISSTRLS